MGLPSDIHESTQLSFVRADTEIQEARMSAEQSKAAMMYTEKMPVISNVSHKTH